MTKEKRQKRFQQKIRHVLRQLKLRLLSNLSDDRCIKEPHRLAKRSAFNCGNPNCVMCGNPRKFFGEETLQETSFKQTSKWNEE